MNPRYLNAKFLPVNKGGPLVTRQFFVPALLATAVTVAVAAPKSPGTFVGPTACASCHVQETNVWKGTRHHASFDAVESNPKYKEILAVVGDSKSMKTSATCTICHFTMVASGGGKPAAKSGPSCESCHGAASGWLKVHGDYGKGATKDTETKAHALERQMQSELAGMRAPRNLFDIASSCAECHGMAHPALDGTVLGKMLEAGHPLEPEFELVRYSQGTVRHRFYPVGSNGENHVMSAPERARMFLVGAAVRLVSATRALDKSKDPGYRAVQKQRIDDALDALGPVKSLPEVAALIAKPSTEAARKVADTAAARDLSKELGSKLPDPATYK